MEVRAAREIDVVPLAGGGVAVLVGPRGDGFQRGPRFQGEQPLDFGTGGGCQVIVGNVGNDGMAVAAPCVKIAGRQEEDESKQEARVHHAMIPGGRAEPWAPAGARSAPVLSRTRRDELLQVGDPFLFRKEGHDVRDCQAVALPEH